MFDKNRLHLISNKIMSVRTRLLSSHPFLGRLLLHLQLGYAECGTAFTDMKRIVFDPAFAERLSEGELRFVFLHEIMHCVLHHCTRGHNLRPRLYNMACDIVVNSLIMETLSVSEYVVDGCKAMHLVPDGREGRLFNAEEVYEILLNAPESQIEKRYRESGFDTHITWKQIIGSLSDDEWDQYIKDAARIAGSGSGLPYGIFRYIKEIYHTSKVNWRQLLHDFIQKDKSDFVFNSPDRRFQDDIILPSFQNNVYGSKIDRLWFLIDTSGSISDDALSEAFNEIKDALYQIEHLSGFLSFFDTEVTAPLSFDNAKNLSEIKPIGGGGTNFETIFMKMEEFFENDLPSALIILTDGYADFPDEDVAKNVPVMWIIIDSDIEPP